MSDPLAIFEEWASMDSLFAAEYEQAQRSIWRARQWAAWMERGGIESGRIRIGTADTWYRRLEWSPQAWDALHGPDGPRRSS